MGARPAPPWTEVAQALEDAASLIELTAELDTDLHDPTGVALGRLTPALATPIARSLRAAAHMVRRHRHVLGLPINHDLALAGAVMGRDLGHSR